MAAAIRAKAPTASKAAAVNKVEQSAAIWQAVGYLAGKENRRDDLTAGATYRVDLSIAARIDGGPVFRQEYSGPLTVGHDSEVAASHTPGGDKLLFAYALSKLNAATREALLREIAEGYLAGGELPEVAAEIVGAVDTLCAKLRAGKRQPRRGSVKFDATPAAAPVGLVG